MRRRTVLLLSAGTLLILTPLLAYRALDVATTSDHSRFAVSNTAKEAAERNVLVSILPVRGNPLSYHGVSFIVNEAWIEAASQIHYRWVLWGPYSRRLGCRRLVFTLASADGSPLPAAAMDSLSSGMNDAADFLFGDSGMWQVSGFGSPSPSYSFDLGQTIVDTLWVPLSLYPVAGSPCRV